MNWSGIAILGLVLAAVIAGTVIALHDGNLRINRALAQFDADRSVREARQADQIGRALFDRPDAGEVSSRDVLVFATGAAFLAIVLVGCLWGGIGGAL